MASRTPLRTLMTLPLVLLLLGIGVPADASGNEAQSSPSLTSSIAAQADLSRLAARLHGSSLVPVVTSDFPSEPGLRDAWSFTQSSPATPHGRTRRPWLWVGVAGGFAAAVYLLAGRLDGNGAPTCCSAAPPNPLR